MGVTVAFSFFRPGVESVTDIPSPMTAKELTLGEVVFSSYFVFLGGSGDGEVGLPGLPLCVSTSLLDVVVEAGCCILVQSSGDCCSEYSVQSFWDLFCVQFLPRITLSAAMMAAVFLSKSVGPQSFSLSSRSPAR